MRKSIIDTSSVTRVGLDLAKRVFRIHAVDAAGSVVIARSVNRALCGEPGGTDAPSGARAHGRATHGGAQRPARPSVGDRRGRRAGGSERLRAQGAGRRRRR